MAGAAAAVAVMGALAGPAVAEPPPPKVMLGDILLGRFPSGLLPRGYVVTLVHDYRLSAASREHHAVGAAAINLNHGRAALIYVVFPTARAAIMSWHDALAAHGVAVTIGSYAGRIVDGSSSQGETTLVGWRQGFVLIEAISTNPLPGHVRKTRIDTKLLASAAARYLEILSR